MKILKKNILTFVILNVTAITLPIYLSGCGGASPSASPKEVASSGTGSGSSSTGSSGSGSSTSGSSSSGSSSSGSSSSGSSSSGSTSGSGSSGVDNSSVASSSGATAPAGALKVSNIQKLSNWDGMYDSGTGTSSSTSSGQMSMTGSPSRSGSARKFVTKFSNNGGERYWVSFGADTASKNFLYDAWIYFDNSAGSIANLELDMNQVVSNGQTIIYGFQCDGYSGTWDYTRNNGTPTKPNDGWVHSKAACNPRNWSRNAWHHVQIQYSRDNSGNVTYKAVWLDGKKQDLNVTVPSTFALGWGSTLLTNFQIDGIGNGSATAYLDDLTIYRW